MSFNHKSAPASPLRWLPLLLAAAPALAQTSDTLPPIIVKAGDTPRLDKQVSVGSNLDLTLRDTPASVDVITREQLDARGDSSVVNALTRATGISSLGHPGNSGSALSARGFTDSTSVMILYDGTRQYGNVSPSFPFDTWNVERIEVLRGPASVIYGDGAIGGVINIVPKKPTKGPVRHEVQATLGTDDKAALAYGSGGSLSEALSYRFDISGDRYDGWVDRGESRNLTVSGALQLDVSRDLMFKLSYAQGEQHPMQYAGVPLVGGQPLEAIRSNNYNVQDSEIKYLDKWTELSMQWTPASHTVVRSRLYYIQSDRYWRNAEEFTYNTATGRVDRAGNTEIAHDQTQLGNTTDAAFTGRLFGLPNRVSVGFDVNTSSFRHTNNTYTGSSGPVDLYHPVPGDYASPYPFIPRYENTADQYAFFAEDRLELSPQFSIVGGLRHDSVRIQRDNLVTGTQDFDERYSNTGGRLGMVWELRPDTSLYAQYSEAADPARAMLFLTTANSRFDYTRGQQVEIGIKQSIFDKRGDWSLALYEIRKNDLLTRDSTNPSVWIQVGQQSTRGIEGTLSLPLGKSVQLDANVALLDAQFDDFTETVSGQPVSRDGNTPANVPEQQANVWLGWKMLPGWTLSGGLRYVGSRYANTANTIELSSYTTTDLALRWDVQPATSLTLRGFNVFDKYYFTTAYYSGTQWLVGEGRRVELTLNHRF